ncbi:glycosyltransferase [bacterium]|nr:glycosyltransferase [bacterium]
MPSKSITKNYKFDVSVNITTHAEGILIHKTLRSIYAGMQYALNRGLKIECNLSSDNGDEITLKSIDDFIKEHTDIKISVHKISVKDPSLSRNYLIDLSQGKYLAMFDGDDFFTENYLYDAFVLAEKNIEPAIYSARYIIVFEGDHYLVEKFDSSSAVDVEKNMFETNYFISQSFIHSDVFKNVKFAQNTAGYGMEDWHFFCEALAHGYKFYNIPNTLFFYRRKKSGSLLSSHLQSAAVIRPTKLFEPEIFSKLPSSRGKVVKTIAPKNKKAAIKQTISRHLSQFELTHHYAKVQYTLHRNIISALKSRYLKPKTKNFDTGVIKVPVPERLEAIGFTSELVHLWGKVNQYEPMIRASADMLRYIPIVGYPINATVSDFYYDFCNSNVDSAISDIVLVPHLTKGGADLAAINLVKVLNQKSKGEKILVMTTINADSPWLNALEGLDNVICVETKSLDVALKDDEQISLIVRIIQNWKVKRLTIINSEIGYKVVTQYGQALKDVGCMTYLHTFAFNMTDDGYLFNWIANGLVDAYKGVDTYVTDSSVYKKQLEEINGFLPSKVTTLYSPAPNSKNPKTDFELKKRVLWASRVCDDKLVDVLIEVGKLLDNEDIQLDIFGAMDDNYSKNDRFKKAISPYKNVVYKGTYDGFSSLSTNEYDMFLFTSKNEGLPFVILEACSANIFIVGASVGGVEECILNGQNGLLVKDKFNPKAYFEAVMQAYEKNYAINQVQIKQANNKILQRHSEQEYAKSVADLMGI